MTTGTVGEVQGIGSVVSVITPPFFILFVHFLKQGNLHWLSFLSLILTGLTLRCTKGDFVDMFDKVHLGCSRSAGEVMAIVVVNNVDGRRYVVEFRFKLTLGIHLTRRSRELHS